MSPERVRCIGPCARCLHQERCAPNIRRIRADHSSHLHDVIAAGGDARDLPRLVLECAAGQFTPR